VSLSVAMITRGEGDHVPALLGLIRPAADEVIVALDDRAGPEAEAALAAAADLVVRYPYAEPVERPRAWLHARARGDWVLTIDDDELPGRRLLDALPELARARDVTHYWLPRRWLWPTADRWLDARPWRPDYQLRLAVNDPRVLSFPGQMHVPVAAIGPGRYLELPLYHADCLLNPVEARERKARRYERLRPGKRTAGRPLNEAYYLPERVDPPTAGVPADDRALIAAVLGGGRLGSGPGGEVVAADRAEIDRHWAARDFGETAYAARLTLLEDPPPLRTGAAETLDVRVENLGDEVWPWAGAGGSVIAVGYRWLREGAAEEGLHTPLPADLPPGGSAVVPVALRGPAEPGRWTLELDLVHEHVRWFERPVPAEVEVAPRRLVAVLDPGTLDGLLAALETLEPEEEPVVVTDRPDELARSFAGAIVPDPAGSGADRLVVPAELVREGRRRPLLAALRSARRLRIPVRASTGEELTPWSVARRRLG
jgi:hypothetical protein